MDKPLVFSLIYAWSAAAFCPLNLSLICYWKVRRRRRLMVCRRVSVCVAELWGSESRSGPRKVSLSHTENNRAVCCARARAESIIELVVVALLCKSVWRERDWCWSCPASVNWSSCNLTTVSAANRETRRAYNVVNKKISKASKIYDKILNLPFLSFFIWLAL